MLGLGEPPDRIGRIDGRARVAGIREDRLVFWADGDAWERVADGAFTAGGISDPGRVLVLESAAATGAGFVVVGGDGYCLHEPCTYQDAVIWTSADGRSWSRVPHDARFTGASLVEAISWGSRFVVGGVYDGKAVTWLSE